MNKITLKNIIYKNYLKTTLTSIFFIEIILIISYFYVNASIVDKSIAFVLKDIKQSVSYVVKDTKSHIALSLKIIEDKTKILQNEHQNFFNNFNNFEIKNRVDFQFAENGMYYKKSNVGASVVVSKNTNIDSYLKDELQRTETFDNNLKTIVEENEMIVASYFNSRHNYSRYFPYLNESYNVFPIDIKMENYNFYYKADIKHNPEKKVVWTDVYLDPAGLGWMISSIAPIYKNGILEGVSGVDVTVNKIVEKILNSKMPYNASSFIVDKSLNMIAMDKKTSEILKIKDFDKDRYIENEKISKTIFKKEGNSLNIKNKDLRIFLNKFINEKKDKNEFLINNEKYILFSEKIDKFSWHLVTFVKEDDILKEVKDLEKEYKNFGFLLLGFIFIFYTLFFIYLYKKAKDFVFLLNKPLSKIINMTRHLGNEKDVVKLDDCGIVEIDILNNNFNDLALQLEDRTKKLIEAEASRTLHEKLSITDALTKVYNRRFLEEFSKQYFEILKREQNSFALLLVDIDDFKSINDTFGHDTGDEVLIKLVEIIDDIIRDNDFIVRLGGDEFLVLLPNTNLSQTKIVANKILASINSNKKFTVSIGSSEYKIEDTDINCLIKKLIRHYIKRKTWGKTLLFKIL